IIYATTDDMIRAAPQLNKGASVRLIIAFDGLARGRCGSIIQILLPSEVYRVRFDNESRLRLVYGWILNRITVSLWRSPGGAGQTSPQTHAPLLSAAGNRGACAL